MLRQSFSLLVDYVTIVGEAFIPPLTRPVLALILCHGIPAAPPDPTEPGYPALARRLAEAGFATFIFNFRGTGASGGNLDLVGWSHDLKAVVDFALSLDGIRERLVVMGFSAGAAVAVHLAAHDPRVAGVVALACPARFREEGAQAMLEHCRRLWLIRDPAFLASVEEWWQHFLQLSPLLWIDKISPRPLLLIHGEKDELIPQEEAASLYEKAGVPKEIRIIPDAGHRLRREERAIKAALAWLSQFLR